MDEARLTAIEEKVAYMEKAVSDLDGVVRDVSSRLDTLLAQVQRLTGIERVIAEREAPADDKPPHY
jgi:uncharacterized coiled-coil protein SlyX